MWARRRSTDEIYAVILAAIDVEVNHRAQVRRVQLRSNLNRARLKFYVDELERHGLVTVMWQTWLEVTPKGAAFLKAYGEALELLGRKIEVL